MAISRMSYFLCSGMYQCKYNGHWFLQAHVTQQENFNVIINQSHYASLSLCTRFLPGFDVLKPSAKNIMKYAAPLLIGFIFTKDYFELTIKGEMVADSMLVMCKKK
jgi:hypothetical protein